MKLHLIYLQQILVDAGKPGDLIGLGLQHLGPVQLGRGRDTRPAKAR
jgi:hypothetical protein